MASDHLSRLGAARVELSGSDHVSLRVFISPLWTVMSSVFEVVLGWRRGCPREWADYVRERSAGVDLSAYRILDRPDRTVPNFLLPVPPSSTPTIAEELKALASTPGKAVRRDLRAEFGRSTPEEFIPYAVDTRAAFSDFCATTQDYWDAVFAPIWPRIRAVLEREVVVSGRTLATQGTSATLAAIHPSFRLRGDNLMFDQSRPGDVTARVSNRRIALIPVVAGVDANITSLDRADEIVLAYSAKGSSSVWQKSGVQASAGLVDLLGESRAKILASLEEPATTTMLATALGLAPATVSHHLSALADQDLADPTRIGNSVYYEVTARGRALGDVFE